MLKQVRKEEFERTGQTSAALSSSEYDRAHAHENALIAMMVARRRLQRPGHWAEESNVTVAEVRAMLKDPAERASLDAELALLVERTRPSFNILNQPDSEHSLTPIQMIVELTWHAGQSYPDRSIDSVSGLLGQEAMAMHAQQVINAIGYDLIDTTAFHASSGQSLLHVSSVRGHHTFVGLILDYVDSAQFAVDQAASSREVDVRRAIIYRSANTLDNAARNLADHRLHGVHEAIGQKSEVTRLRLALRDPQTLSLDITPEQMHTELARFLSKHPLLHFSRSGMRKINSCHLCQTHIKPVLATRAVSACCTQLLRPPAARRQTLACHDALCRFALASHLCVCWLFPLSCCLVVQVEGPWEALPESEGESPSSSPAGSLYDPSEAGDSGAESEDSAYTVTQLSKKKGKRPRNRAARLFTREEVEEIEELEVQQRTVEVNEDVAELVRSNPALFNEAKQVEPTQTFTSSSTSRVTDRVQPARRSSLRQARLLTQEDTMIVRVRFDLDRVQPTAATQVAAGAAQEKAAAAAGVAQAAALSPSASELQLISMTSMAERGREFVALSESEASASPPLKKVKVTQTIAKRVRRRIRTETPVSGDDIEQLVSTRTWTLRGRSESPLMRDEKLIAACLTLCCLSCSRPPQPPHPPRSLLPPACPSALL